MAHAAATTYPGLDPAGARRALRRESKTTTNANAIGVPCREGERCLSAYCTGSFACHMHHTLTLLLGSIGGRGNPIPNMSANGTIHPSCTIDEGMISTARRKRQALRFRSQKLLRAFVALWRALSISVPPPHRIRNRHKHLMKVARSYMVAHAEGAQREESSKPD